VTVNFARWNHILIPTTKAGRDRFRRSAVGRAIRPFAWLYGALSEEGRVLAVATMAVGGFGLDVSATAVYLLWAALAGLLLASLAWSFAYRLEGVRVEVESPRRVTVGEAVTFSITVRDDGSTGRDRHAVRVHGPFLPWDGAWIGRAPRLARIPRAGAIRAELTARFSARGEHHLDPFFATALAPLGLAQGAPASSSGVRFLVVPRIARVVRLSLPEGSRDQPGGVARASRTGESLELRGVRPYRAGDPVRLLHARSSARAGTPVVREYQEEHERRVGVVVDVAPPVSLPRVPFRSGAADARRREAILELAAGVVAFLARGEALLDRLVVQGRVHDLTLGRHLGFLEQALDVLACVDAGAPPVPAARLLACLTPSLTRLSCVIVVAPAWDGGALATSIRAAGAACTTLVVGEGGAPGPGVREVSMKAITRGDALVL